MINTHKLLGAVAVWLGLLGAQLIMVACLLALWIIFAALAEIIGASLLVGIIFVCLISTFFTVMWWHNDAT